MNAAVKWYLKSLVYVILALLFFIGVSAFLALVPISTQTTAAATFRELSAKQDGIFFIGHIFSIDIPARTFQVVWIFGACGSLIMDTNVALRYDLDRSACGAPNIPIRVYVNGYCKLALIIVAFPTYASVISHPYFRGLQTSYDPTDFHSLDPITNKSVIVPSFQTTLGLDIGTAQLGPDRIFDQSFWYPFDFYHSGATFFALNGNDNTSLPIVRAVFTDPVNNFAPVSLETASRSVFNGTQVYSRSTSLELRRTTNAKMYTLLLFIVNWGLTLLVAYITTLAQLGEKLGEGLVVLPLTIILTMPTIRGLFVENPPFGILLDNIGLVLQMIIVSVCSIVILIPSVAKSMKLYEKAPIEEH